MAVCTMFCALLHYCKRRRRRGRGFYNPEIKDQMLINVRDQENFRAEVQYLITLFRIDFVPKWSQTCTKTIV